MKSQRNFDDPNLRNWDKLYADFMSHTRDTLPEDSNPRPLLPGMGDGQEATQCCLQFARKYIFTTLRDSVLVIDQHRAHLKVLYERYLASSAADSCVSQRVMFPETVSLTPEQQIALAEVESDLRRLGFELTLAASAPGQEPVSTSLPPSGIGENYQLTAVPSDLHGADPKDLVLRILDSVSEDSINYGADQRPADSVMRRMVLVMARSAAITRGVLLSPEEMEHLVADLFSLPDPAFTPNGNRIYASLDESSLLRLLG